MLPCAMSALCFMLCKDEPLYELDLSGRRDDASARSSALALHAALDGVDRATAAASAASGGGACFLKVVDRANELLVSAHVTAGGARLLLLHDGRAEDGVRAFFAEVVELWVRRRREREREKERGRERERKREGEREREGGGAA